MLQTVVETPEYLRRAQTIKVAEKERTAIVNMIASNPESGVSLGGGLRKIRIARRGKGKSGGYRILYFFRTADVPIFLLSLFAKNEKANISHSEKAELIQICDLIAETYEQKNE